MEVRKYQAKGICMSCNNPVGGDVTVIITKISEESGQEQAYLVHEGCQNDMIRNVQFRNELERSSLT